MEVPLVLLCAVIVMSSFPLTKCEKKVSYNGEVTDMAIDGSSPKNILVHNTFHLPPMDQERTSDTIEDTQFQDPSMVGDRYNFQSDGMIVLEGKIDWLMKSNKHILKIVNELEYKINRSLEMTTVSENDRLSSAPKSTIDLMDNLEVMNLLNNIHQFILASNSKSKQSDLLEADQIQVIKDFVSSIESDRRNCEQMTSSSPNVVDQVLSNSWKTIQYLEKVTGMVQDIDERTVRMFDKSCRLGKTFSIGNYNDDCSCKNDMANKNRYEFVNRRNERYENTYRNVKRDTNRVTFEPTEYNCHDLKIRKNGIYKFASKDEVSNEAGRFFYERYCDFNTNGGAWTVIERRFINDQRENFNRSWLDYKLGFGELDKEFWFGNDFIHKLTSDEDVELRIVLEYLNGQKGWAEYSLFRVDSEEYNYNLIIGGYRGTIQGGLFYHNDQEFSTYDRQNDNNDNLSCASSYGNGWWFNNCTQILNLDYKGITWENWLGSNFLKSSKMMVRPKGLWDDGDNREGGYIYTSSAMDLP